jgi:hypothetical protein
LELYKSFLLPFHIVFAQLYFIYGFDAEVSCLTLKARCQFYGPSIRLYLLRVLLSVTGTVEGNGGGKFSYLFS